MGRGFEREFRDLTDGDTIPSVKLHITANAKEGYEVEKNFIAVAIIGIMKTGDVDSTHFAVQTDTGVIGAINEHTARLLLRAIPRLMIEISRCAQKAKAAESGGGEGV
jgi:hypothetical protein